MAVNLFLAVTDDSWFEFLRNRPDLTEINFWQPRGTHSFRALEPGELFLFKLRSPRNVVVGAGVFSHATILPAALAWEAFGEANGAPYYAAMIDRIARLRREPADVRANYQIGCRILTQPVFLPDSEWIPVPPTWAPNIVVGRRYSTDTEEGRALWDAFNERLSRSRLVGFAESAERYGQPTLIAPRLGQGAFRLAVTDAYERKCVVTQEKVLPALDAAHIRPYAAGGEHAVRNGLLFRRDIHRLFDLGYVTVSPDLHFEVSRKVRDDFDNGREYYKLHGLPVTKPRNAQQAPETTYLEWHNNNCYRG